MKQAFPPIVDHKSRVLILGSMPGEASLASQQYYAHPRNAFWPIMRALLQLPPESSYAECIVALKKAHIAVWDVLAACERQGSLDSDIKHATLVANDFASFLQQYRNIEAVYCNGQSVAGLFKRHVMKKQSLPASLPITVLPSTSPAHARLPFDQKLQIWRTHLQHF